MLMKSRKSFSLGISFSFSLVFINFSELAFTYSDSTTKTQRARCAIYLKITNKDTGKS